MIEKSMTAMLIEEKNKRKRDRDYFRSTLEEMEDNNKAQKEREASFNLRFEELQKSIKELQEYAKAMFTETDYDGARISTMQEKVEILFDED